MDIVKTLLDIEKMEKKILDKKLIEYYLTSDTVIVFDELANIIDNNDYLEIIEKYNKNIKSSSKILSEFIAVLNDKIKTGNLDNNFINKIKEYNNGNLFPLKLGNLFLNYLNNNIVLTTKEKKLFIFKDNFSIKDLEHSLLTYYNNHYLDITKTSIPKTPFKFIFGEKFQTPIDYLKGVKNLPDRLDLKKRLQNFATILQKELSDIENNENKKNTQEYLKFVIGKGRTTVREQLPTAMVMKKSGLAIEIINERKNEDIEKLKKVFIKSVFNYLEIDPITSIDRLIVLIDNANKQNFNFSKTIASKYRLLGNFNASGLYFEINGKPVIAIDPRENYALIHELGHYVYEQELKNRFSKPLNNLINFGKSKMYSIENNKKNYYYKSTEIFARISEIAYFLDKNDFKPTYNDEKFFTPEIIEKLSKSINTTDGFVQDFNFYKEQNNIYFDFINMTNEELSILYSYPSTYFNLEHKIPVKNIEQEYFDIYKINERKKLGTMVKTVSTMNVTGTYFKELDKKLYELKIIIWDEKQYLKKHSDYRYNSESYYKVKVDNLLSEINNNLFYEILTDNKDFHEYTNIEEFFDNLEYYYKYITEIKNNEILEGFNKIYGILKDIDIIENKQKLIEEKNSIIIPFKEKINQSLILNELIDSCLESKSYTNYLDYYNLIKIKNQFLKLYNDNFPEIKDFKIDDFRENSKIIKEKFLLPLKNIHYKNFNTLVINSNKIDKNYINLIKELYLLKKILIIKNEELLNLRTKNYKFLRNINNELYSLSNKTKNIISYSEEFTIFKEKLNNFDKFKKGSSLLSELKNKINDYKSIDIDFEKKNDKKYIKDFVSTITEDTFFETGNEYKYLNVTNGYLYKTYDLDRFKKIITQDRYLLRLNKNNKIKNIQKITDLVENSNKIQPKELFLIKNIVENVFFKINNIIISTNIHQDIKEILIEDKTNELQNLLKIIDNKLDIDKKIDFTIKSK